ncbi:zinc finger protein 567-like [Microplitis mediator]|uniref:zinc finger protein 567-like n=1 Tax=Microplitis mediator TaxID=375433 RepID=UPI002556B71C|nr:zinc finger protein 567-like [Microplitis mediator]
MLQANLNYLSNFLNIPLDELRKIENPEQSVIVTSIIDVFPSTPEENPPVTREWDEYQNEIQSLEYICQDCFCSFSSAEQHQQHVLSGHANINVLNNEEQELEAENFIPTVRNEDPTHNSVTENSHDVKGHNHHRPSKSLENSKEECPICKKKFSSKQYLAKHKKTHKKDNYYYCHICLYKTKKIRNFESHINKHLDNEFYICHHCGRSYKIKESLEIHLTYGHGLRIQSIDSQENQENRVGKKPKDSLGQKKLPNAKRLKLDAKHNEITHQCDVCLRMTTLQPNFGRDMKKDVNDKLYICCHCGSPLRKKLLENNLEFRHDPKYDSKSFINNKFMCLCCEKTFTDSKSLNRHKATYKKGGNYHCNICLHATALLRNFDKHLVRHFNDKFYICYHCGRPFRKKILLENHLKFRHDPKLPFVNHRESTSFTNKKFMCLFCNEKFKDSKSLCLHKVTHKKGDNYHCNICLYKITRLQNFDRHVEKHFNDELCSCYHCGKSFKEKKRLEHHLDSHRDPNSQLIKHHSTINSRN